LTLAVNLGRGPFLVFPALFSSLEAYEAQFIAPNRQGAQ